MKLYFFPGACSLSVHIVVREAGLNCDLVRVDLKTKRTASGDDYTRINPKGSVPALQLDNGELLTEGAVIVQYLADLVPEKKLLPPPGDFSRYRVQEWLNFIATELHKGFGPLFAGMPEEWQQAARERLQQKFTLTDAALAQKSYLMGDAFTVADAYLFTVLGWAPHFGIDLSSWPALAAYRERVAARPAVQAALSAESA